MTQRGSNRPNVVLIVIDGARADHVSAYGYARQTTPFLDQMAREGVRCTQALTTAPGTLAAHASLFTGLYAVTHGVSDEQPRLRAQPRVLAEYLGDAGYRTGAFCTSVGVSPETGFDRGFGTFVTQRRSGRLTSRALSYGRRAGDRLLRRDDAGARRTNEAVEAWIESESRPFFAFVHYHEAHAPFRLPPPYDHHFLTRTVSAAEVRSVNREASGFMDTPGGPAPEDLAVFTALYDAALHYIDARIQELANWLQLHGCWDDTLVVITADHGQSLGEHGRVGHNFDLSDGVLRVPLILRCPGRVPQGFVSEDIAQSVDVLPTILRLVGCGIPEGLHGHPLLEGERATHGPTFAVAERYRTRAAGASRRISGLDARTLGLREKAIRTRRYKYVWRSDECNAFFDLQADPAENVNLIDSYGVEAEALREQLFDWLAAVEKADFRPAEAPPETPRARRRAERVTAGRSEAGSR